MLCQITSAVFNIWAPCSFTSPYFPGHVFKPLQTSDLWPVKAVGRRFTAPDFTRDWAAHPRLPAQSSEKKRHFHHVLCTTLLRCAPKPAVHHEHSSTHGAKGDRLRSRHWDLATYQQLAIPPLGLLEGVFKGFSDLFGCWHKWLVSSLSPCFSMIHGSDMYLSIVPVELVLGSLGDNLKVHTTNLTLLACTTYKIHLYFMYLFYTLQIWK